MISKSLIERSRSVLNDTSVLGDLTFASGKGITFSNTGFAQFGTSGPKLKYGTATAIYARNEADTDYTQLVGKSFLATADGFLTLNNSATLPVNIPVTVGSGSHEVQLQIDSNAIIGAAGTGDGAGGATSLTAKLYQNTVVTAGKTITGHSWVAENHTAGDTLTLAESGSIHTNYGASGAVALKLPASATAGTTFKFVVGTAQELRIVVSAAAEAFIVNGGTSTDDGGNDLYLVADDEGEMATFTCIAAGVWLVDVTGTWTPTQP